MPSTNTICRKVIITGTGRAGTTFLVRLLTELGLDTGFTDETWKRDYHEHSAAGLEHDIVHPDAPYIVKNPGLCTQLAPLLETGVFEIDHAFVPIRELNAATCSRARIGGANGNVPGGLWATDDPGRQQAVLGEMFHELVHTLVVHEVPHTFLHFPRFVRDPRYTFRQLAPVLKDIEWPIFEAAFNRIADPSLIHDFSATKPARIVSHIGQEYLANKQRRRRQRHIRRTLTIAAAAIILAFFVFFRRGNSQIPIAGGSGRPQNVLPMSGP